MFFGHMYFFYGGFSCHVFFAHFSEMFHFFFLSICKSPFLCDMNPLSAMYVVELEGGLKTSFSASPGK